MYLFEGRNEIENEKMKKKKIKEKKK